MTSEDLDRFEARRQAAEDDPKKAHDWVMNYGQDLIYELEATRTQLQEAREIIECYVNLDGSCSAYLAWQDRREAFLKEQSDG